MNENTDSQPQSSGTSSETDRKFWLDYLAKLNDRELQKARASGATVWVLLVLAGAVLYQFFQLLPELLESRVPWSSIGVIIALQTDFLVYFGSAVVFLYQYAKGPAERRLFPDLKARANRLLKILIHTTQASLVVLHFVVAEITILPGFVLWTLRLIGAYWLLNLILAFWKYGRAYQKARKLKITIPETTLDMEIYATGLGAAVAAFATTAVFLLAAVGLFHYVDYLTHLLPDAWILSFNAATHIVAAFFLLAFAFYRLLESLSRNVYLKLERDIILESLPPDEIKRRFNFQVLGPRIGEWLKVITDQIEEDKRRLEELLTSAETTCAEIEQVSPEGREARSQELLTMVERGYDDFGAKYLSLTRHILECLEDRKVTGVELQIIEYHTQNLSGTEELLDRYKELVERINRLRR